MSAIAGIFNFDGMPVTVEAIGSMTHAMARRGPDGLSQWAEGPVGLGHCMFRTTPESLEETQPLANEDSSIVLVMDGRVDNFEELRTQLLQRGAALRSRADAELVLRAYETWGEDCPEWIVGEFVFFVWDARRRQFFGARDATGARHFYYHRGDSWFGFASEIKGLTALGRIKLKLNESRILDFIVPDFDRDDMVGTCYQDILRLPAGHSIRVTGQRVETWRYWSPENLPPSTYRSLDECAEAFLEQFRIAVKCRLRSIGPVSAELSGGLDSSSIVSLISKEYREDLGRPLQTISLVERNRAEHLDWRYIQKVTKDGWVDPVTIDPDIPIDVSRDFLDAVARYDEPFESTTGFPRFLMCRAARAKGSRVVLEGRAGDLLFYGFERSVYAIFRRKLYRHLPAALAAYRRQGGGTAGGLSKIARAFLGHVAPDSVRTVYRSMRDELRARTEDDLNILQREAAEIVLNTKFRDRYHSEAQLKPGTDQVHHAQFFTTGWLSFAYEVGVETASSHDVEIRSPFSDRRLVEFAIRMPVEAKLFASWYKNLMRKSMGGVLEESVRWRSDHGGFPRDSFDRSLLNHVPDIWPSPCHPMLAKWIDFKALESVSKTDGGYALFRLKALGQWIDHKSFLL